MSGETSAETLVRQLVAIPSLSGQEQAAVAFLIAALRARGFTAYADAAGNAVGIRSGPPGGTPRDVVLLGHIDTVPGDIAVRVADGILYGRGAVDAKGPLATFVAAAAQADLPPGLRVIVIGAVEEEAASSKGAHAAVRDWAPAYCVIGEPSGWDGVTLGYKGRLLLDYRLRRPMGHTAGRQSGVAEAAIAWWNALDRYVTAYNQDRPRLFDQLLPAIRCFCTKSDGLHDWVELSVGVRLPPGFDVAVLADAAQAWAADGELAVHGFEAAFSAPRTSPLARAFGVALRAAGVPPRFKHKTGTSDMNIVGPVWGCPIVAYGPGDSLLDHTPDEHLVFDEYRRAIDILARVLAQL